MNRKFLLAFKVIKSVLKSWKIKDTKKRSPVIIWILNYISQDIGKMIQN